MFSKPDDPPSVIAARAKELRLIAAWIAEARAEYQSSKGERLVFWLKTLLQPLSLSSQLLTLLACFLTAGTQAKDRGASLTEAGGKESAMKTIKTLLPRKLGPAVTRR